MFLLLFYHIYLTLSIANIFGGSKKDRLDKMSKAKEIKTL